MLVRQPLGSKGIEIVRPVPPRRTKS